MKDVKKNLLKGYTGKPFFHLSMLQFRLQACESS